MGKPKSAAHKFVVKLHKNKTNKTKKTQQRKSKPVVTNLKRLNFKTEAKTASLNVDLGALQNSIQGKSLKKNFNKKKSDKKTPSPKSEIVDINVVTEELSHL